jgi:hypothetical protein
LEKKRWLEAEPVLLKDPECAMLYARLFITEFPGGRWRELEKRLLENKDAAYADIVYEYMGYIHTRWPEGEEAFLRNSHNVMDEFHDYLVNCRDQFTDQDKWKMLKDLSKANLEVLNFLGMTKEIQEYILQHRPDLVGEIPNLDPELAKKYQHEKEIGNVDL